jgi:hypothetical protein
MVIPDAGVRTKPTSLERFTGEIAVPAIGEAAY